jgi:hypothetical protein
MKDTKLISKTIIILIGIMLILLQYFFISIDVVFNYRATMGPIGFITLTPLILGINIIIAEALRDG